MNQVDLSEHNITVENARQSLSSYPKDFYDAFHKICPKGVKEPQDWKPVKKIMKKFSKEIGVYYDTVRRATEQYIYHNLDENAFMYENKFSSDYEKKEALIAVMVAHYELFLKRQKVKTIDIENLDLSQESALKRLEGYYGDWYKAFLRIHPEIVSSNNRKEWEGVQEIIDTLSKSIHEIHVTFQEKKNAIIGATKSLILEIPSKKWESKQDEEIARVKVIMAYEQLTNDIERQAREDSYPLLTEEQAKIKMNAWKGYICQGFSRDMKYCLIELNYGANNVYYDVCPEQHRFKYLFNRENAVC